MEDPKNPEATAIPATGADPRLNPEALAAYVSGDASYQESQKVELSVTSDETMLRRLRDYRYVWNLSAGLPIVVDAEAAWANVLTDVAQRRRWRSRKVAGMAAFSAMALTAGIFSLTRLHSSPSILSSPDTGITTAGVANEYSTNNGERKEIRLRDGTTVILNVASKLRVPASFNGSERAVELQGEALFKVAHNAERAFRVHAGNSNIKVLGTVFSVRSYSAATPTKAGSATSAAQTETRITVASGKIAVAAIASSHTQATTLSAGDIATIAPSGYASVKHVADASSQFAWTEGRLVLTDAPVSEVVAELERWYNVRIEVTNPSLSAKRLTTSFGAHPPTPNQLDDMAAAIGARIQRSNGILRLVPAFVQ